MAISETHFALKGFAIPKFFYGTAWKEERSAELVFKALQSGFRGVDTANQRKHYHEASVGQGIKKFLDLNLACREDLFLQSKFTFAQGQDHRKPYDESDPFVQQVTDSFASSLRHLGTEYLDSYVLHGPYFSQGISEEDLATWSAMEDILNDEQVRFLGVSNISAEQLLLLCAKVKVKPSFVQNRCYSNQAWDQEVREICKAQGIQYQGFSLLTANQSELSLPEVHSIAKKYHKSIAQITFRFCQQLGMITLTGTTNPIHMIEDLNIYDFSLTPDEMILLEGIGV